MTSETSLAPVELLVQLNRLGVRVAAKGEALSLRPASRAPPPLLEEVRASKAEILALLATPRRRWILQATATIEKIDDQDFVRTYGTSSMNARRSPLSTAAWMTMEPDYWLMRP